MTAAECHESARATREEARVVPRSADFLCRVRLLLRRGGWRHGLAPVSRDARARLVPDFWSRNEAAVGKRFRLPRDRGSRCHASI